MKHLVYLLFAFSLLASGNYIKAQSNIWIDVPETNIELVGNRYITPQAYRTVRLNLEAAKILLGSAPMEFTEGYRSKLLIPLPMPDGSFQNFAFWESPTMEPELQAKFPEIRTYTGQGIDDPDATLKFDLTPQGFHAQILSPHGRVFIDPYSQGDVHNYISYFTRDFVRDADFICFTEFDEYEPLYDFEKPLIPTGPYLRTYRLAVAATGEYTIFHGGTVQLGLAAVITTVSRVNGIYEREVAVSLVLVENNYQIIYTDPNSDPYSNFDGLAMLTQNIDNLNSVIGSANYDIGHVFSTGGGSRAYPGVVCTANKGGGVTGSSSPIGDPFDVDYVAHEMGHQFNARHTFNGDAGGCLAHRNEQTAYEPGSGSTIMAYANLCGNQDLQNSSDAYFHTISFDQIVSFTHSGSGNNCPGVSNTGNRAPVVTVPAGGFTIPTNTPFSLTGSATDADGDPLTYCWEQFDLGPAGHPNSPSGNAPIFRSFLPNSSPTRTFPRLSDLLNNTQTIGEILPSYGRNLTFRLTARDNRAWGGGVDYKQISFAVDGNSGPFVVTSPNTNVSWMGNTQQTITWNVANTNSSPVNCSNVKILLSTDGGYNFTTVLKANTPNDGSEVVTIPDLPTTYARIKVEAINNIFFDISNVNFTITPHIFAHDYTIINLTPNITNPVVGQLVTFTGTLKNVGSSTEPSAQPVKLFVNGNEITVTTTIPSLAPGQSTQVSLNWIAQQGAHNIKMQCYLTGDQNPSNDFDQITINVGVVGNLLVDGSTSPISNITLNPNSTGNFSVVLQNSGSASISGSVSKSGTNAAWVTLSSGTSYFLNPSASQQYNYSVTIPNGTSPGNYNATIRFSYNSGANYVDLVLQIKVINFVSGLFEDVIFNGTALIDGNSESTTGLYFPPGPGSFYLDNYTNTPSIDYYKQFEYNVSEDQYKRMNGSTWDITAFKEEGNASIRLFIQPKNKFKTYSSNVNQASNDIMEWWSVGTNTVRISLDNFIHNNNDVKWNIYNTGVYVRYSQSAWAQSYSVSQSNINLWTAGWNRGRIYFDVNSLNKSGKVHLFINGQKARTVTVSSTGTNQYFTLSPDDLTTSNYINIKGDYDDKTRITISNIRLIVEYYSGEPNLSCTKTLSIDSVLLNQNANVNMLFENIGSNVAEATQYDDRPLPTGLTRVSGQLNGTIGTIHPNTNKTASYTVRGDQIGSYTFGGTNVTYYNPSGNQYTTSFNAINLIVMGGNLIVNGMLSTYQSNVLDTVLISATVTGSVLNNSVNDAQVLCTVTRPNFTTSTFYLIFNSNSQKYEGSYVQTNLVGSYQVEIQAQRSYYNEGSLSEPITFTVSSPLSPPNIQVMPNSFAFSLATDSIETKILTISNLGESALTWNISDTELSLDGFKLKFINGSAINSLNPSKKVSKPLAEVNNDSTNKLLLSNISYLNKNQEVDLLDSKDSILSHKILSLDPKMMSANSYRSNVLYDNGPLVNSPGTGANGADESVLQNISLGLNLYGFGNQFSFGNRIADDFTVTDPAGWTVQSIKFFAYQTGSTTSSTITSINYRIWDGPPDNPSSNIIYGDTVSNKLISTEWTNVFRVTETSSGNTERPIMVSTVSADIYLMQGTYWVDWQCDGLLSSGPWAPPITINGVAITGNALQKVNLWQPALDEGTSNPQQGFPFVVIGQSGSNCPWLSENPTSGTIPAGGSVDINIVADATGLSHGTYNANLMISSNDPINPYISIPVNLSVLSSNYQPIVTIEYPTSGSIVSNPNITVRGTATDPVEVVIQVEVKLNNGNWELASGTNYWTHPLVLADGVNTICARAVDDEGAYSQEVCVSVTYFALPARWSNLNPVPQGNTLRSVYFINNTTGWMAGTGGLILKTTNFGEEWTQQVTNTGTALKAIYFVDEFNGWAVGELGIILNTNNGGNTWQYQTSNVSANLNAVKFINSSTGWAVGYSGTILKTTNGGLTWISQSSGVTTALFDIDFYDENFLVAVGGYTSSGGGAPPHSTILKTTDGGSTWIDKNSSLSARGLIYGVEIIDGNLIRGCGQVYWLYKSTDGGENWSYSGYSSNMGSEQIDGMGGFRDIYFKDSNVGYAVGGEYQSGGLPKDRKIIMTTDGGSSWSSKLNQTGEHNIFSTYVTNDNKGLSIGSNGVILRSTDEGNTWKQQLSGSGIAAAVNIKSIYFINENVGFAVGERMNYSGDLPGGAILKTTNGGKVWLITNFIGNQGDYLVDIFFIDENTGWTIFNKISPFPPPSVLKTTDGGNSWNSYDNGPGSGLTSVFFIDQNNGWITSSSGIYASTNGGSGWIKINELSSSSAFFLNPNTGFVASPTGVYKTTDGGTNWTQKSDVSSSSIYFVDNNTGWFSGGGGVIYKTTDGGENWLSKTSGTTQGLSNIHFSDLNNGLAAGGNGTLVKTTDGGESWQIINTGTSKSFNSVKVYNPGLAWAAGWDGLMLKYFNESLALPTITTSVNSLTDFGNINVGQSSSSQNYTVSGTDLSNDILITAPEGFQISLNSNSGYTNTLTLTPSGGGVPITVIYVRFTPTIAQTYSGNISHASTGTTTKNVSVSGTGMISGCQPEWPFVSGTGSHATIAIPLSSNPQLCDGSLQPGDVIGVFFTRNDSLICAGYSFWTGTGNIAITAWGNNPQTPVKDGFAPGELIKFKIWSTAECSEYMANVSYTQGDGYFYPDGMYVLESMNAVCTITQTINLITGWSMISSYVEPIEPHLDTVMHAVKTNMELMKNGKGKVYWPKFGINDILNWNVIDGYQIFMHQADTLNITGLKVDNQTKPIPLDQGWNLVSYLLDCTIDIEIALASISSYLVIAKNGIGQVYWPEFSINDIGNMQPGQGYQLYVSSACTLTYPNCPPLVAKSIRGGEEETEVQGAVIKKQPLSHYANALKNTGGNATMVVSSAAFEEGDEVGVFSSSGILVGSGAVKRGRAVISIWSDNTMTEETDGAKDGEELYLNLWKKNNKEEINLKITRLTEVLSGSIQTEKLHYQTDGLYVVEAEEAILIPASYILEQNYPNPFNPSTVIRYGIPTDGKVRLEVYDVIGQKVDVLIDDIQQAGYYEVKFTNLKLSSGVYFYRLQAGGYVNVKKMLMIK